MKFPAKTVGWLFQFLSQRLRSFGFFCDGQNQTFRWHVRVPVKISANLHQSFLLSYIFLIGNWFLFQIFYDAVLRPSISSTLGRRSRRSAFDPADLNLVLNKVHRYYQWQRYSPIFSSIHNMGTERGTTTEHGMNSKDICTIDLMKCLYVVSLPVFK